MAVAAVATSAKISTSRIEADLIEARQRLLTEHLQRANAATRQEESHQAAEDRQHEALDQELACEPGPARAERGAYRELVDAAGGTHERKVRDVHAGDEQNESHGGKNQLQRAARARHHLLVQRRRDNRAQFRGRPAFLHRPRQRGQLRLCL